MSVPVLRLQWRVSHEERARGDNISKSCCRKAVAAADSTCQSQSRCPEEPVVQQTGDERITKLVTGRKNVNRRRAKPNQNYLKRNEKKSKMQSYVCKANRACLWERRAPGRRSRKPKVDTFTPADDANCSGTSSGWMRGWSVLGSVPLMGSVALVWSLLMARWIDSKAYALFPPH